MEKNWVKIFSSNQIHSVKLLKAILEEEEVDVFEMNHQSPYVLLGEYELYVPSSDVIKAKYILDKHHIE